MEIKTVLRDLWSCITEKSNGVNIVRVKFSKKIETNILPNRYNLQTCEKCDIINCYFSFNEGSKIKHCSAWQCYYCSNYYAKKDKFDRYFENCTSHPGYVYDFNTQSLLMFKGNLKYKGDIQLVAYIDF